MMKKNIICLLLTVVCCIGAYGENSLRYDFDNKVIYASGISMPQTATLLQVLQVLPELLHRPNDNILENYGLRIEGLSVGGSSDAILSQILLMDIEKINVTNSAASNYVNNGQGGEIDVILKKLSDGTSGNAFAMLGLPSDYIPGFSINNKSSRWAVRSFFTGEVYNHEDIDTYYQTVNPGQTVPASAKETLEEKINMHQMAKLYAFYTGSKDELKLSFSEMMNKTSNTLLSRRSTAVSYGQRDNLSRKLDIICKTAYTHKFAWNGSAVVEALYNYAPNRSKTTMTTDTDIFSESDDNKHSISGKVEYGQYLYWGPSGNRQQGSTGYFRFQTGCKYNYSHLHTDADQQFGEYIPSSNTTYNNLFLSPYLTLKSSLGKVKIMAKMEYQIYHYSLGAIQSLNDESDDPMSYDYTNKNFVGAFVTTWNIGNDHALRLMANRSLKRPSESQMFPFMLYSISNIRIEQGNAELKPMVMNTLELEYLFNHDTGTDRWEMSIGGRYIHTIDNINKITKYVEEVDDNVTTWENGSNDNIMNLNAMLSWKHNWVSVTAIGNFFNRHSVGMDTNYRYCNLSFMPQIHTSNDWNICLALYHNTKQEQKSTTLPSLTTLSLIASKMWNKKLTAFLFGTLSLRHWIDEVTVLSSGALDSKTYVPVTNSIYAGIRYNF